MSKSVAIASPICQQSKILKEFLESLERLECEEIEVYYLFVDDNQEEESKQLLKKFGRKHERARIIASQESSKYIVDDYTHRWNDEIVAKVTHFKNTLIEIAKEEYYDYLFFIDSDIVLHPKTLKQLIADKKDIVSNIFWTQWGPNTQELPQVWMQDAYAFHSAKANQLITAEEIEEQNKAFFEKLKKPGVYPVGGLGACTLISQEALQRGVNFDDIFNVSFWGEDRHFCIRAVVLGLELFVDTHYPALHIYRLKDLEKVEEYKVTCNQREEEILKIQAAEFIKKVVQSMNSYSYEEPLSYGWQKDLTLEAAQRQIVRLEEDRKRVIRQQIINTCQVKTVIVSINEEENLIHAKLVYQNEGYRRGYSYCEAYEGECSVLRNEGKGFVMTQFELCKKMLPKSPYIVRKIQMRPDLTVSMCVKNEEGRYLERVLESASQYANRFVIIDDGSEDKTVQICEDLIGEKLTLIQNKVSKFSNEVTLRKQQWYETISMKPDWIMCLDADEYFEERAREVIPQLMQERECDAYAFRLYDFWNEQDYREDNLWDAHHSYRSFMIRYQRQYQYSFRETVQHCGRMPDVLTKMVTKTSNLRLKHYGWARAEDRLKKFSRYMTLDPEGKCGILEQYQSILDPYPNLVRWDEGSIEQ